MIGSPTEKTSSLSNRFHSFSSSRDSESDNAPTILFVHVFTSNRIAASNAYGTVTTTHTRSLSNTLWLRRFLIPRRNLTTNTEYTAVLNRGEITKSTQPGSPYRSIPSTGVNNINIRSQIGDCRCLPPVVKEPRHSEQTSEPKH